MILVQLVHITCYNILEDNQQVFSGQQIKIVIPLVLPSKL